MTRVIEISANLMPKRRGGAIPSGGRTRKKKAGKKRKPNKWIQHVMKVKRSNPSMSLKQAIMKAKKTYKK